MASRTLRSRLIVAAVSLAAFALLLAAAAGSRPGARDPVTAVDTLLRSRAALVTDEGAYAPYLDAPNAAASLAESARTATEGVSPLPAWRAPYVSWRSATEAEVVVVWQRDAAHPDWQRASAFGVRLEAGRWRIVTATSLDATIPPPVGSGR